MTDVLTERRVSHRRLDKQTTLTPAIIYQLQLGEKQAQVHHSTVPEHHSTRTQG